MSRWFAVFLSVLLVSAYAVPQDCIRKAWNWKVDQKAALELQQFVNQGHEPWRMDDKSAVASEVIAERKKDWRDYNTILRVPEQISATKDTALMVARSEDGCVRYEVTLKKYDWLLHSAHDDWRWVIWLPASVERIECPPEH
ncbi:MAG: hypothetical protein WB555_13045 [Candidatus Korobacteraceae bacterium]